MNKICCIGLGKLGLIFANILAQYCSKVYGFDTDKSIKNIIKYNKKSNEPKLNYLIKKNENKFFFEDNFKKIISDTNCAFIVVPTPSKKNKEFDNKNIFSTLRQIGPYLKNKKKYIINITSTVNPGSCRKFIKYLEKKYNVNHGIHFIITYNPHLIALGSIYNDIINSDVVLLGSNEKYGHHFLKKLYKKMVMRF